MASQSPLLLVPVWTGILGTLLLQPLLLVLTHTHKAADALLNQHEMPGLLLGNQAHPTLFRPHVPHPPNPCYESWLTPSSSPSLPFSAWTRTSMPAMRLAGSACSARVAGWCRKGQHHLAFMWAAMASRPPQARVGSQHVCRLTTCAGS